MNDDLVLPRRVSSSKPDDDFGRQVFQFAADMEAFSKKVKTKIRALEAVDIVAAAAGAVPGAHASTHLPGGTDALTTAAAGTITPGDSASAGSAASFAASDHRHAIAGFGSTSGKFCEGNDARLSDDRTASGLRTASTVVSVSAATAPTAGQVLKATSSTVATWQTPTTGTVDSELFSAPSSPHASLDDEFPGTSLDAKWTMRDSGGTTVTPSSPVDAYTAFNTGAKVSVGRTFWNSWAQVQVANTGSNFTLCQPYSVPTNMFIWARVAVQRDSSPANDAGFCVLIFAASSGGKPDLLNHVHVGYQPDVSNARLDFGKIAGGASSTINSGGAMGLAQGTVYEYYGIQKIGTTYHGWAFSGARGVAYLGSTTHASTMAFVGFWFLDVSSTPGNFLVGIDFFRAVDNVTSYLP